MRSLAALSVAAAVVRVQAAGTTRCGSGWGDANSNCRSACGGDADCPSPQTCFASLSLAPCPTAPAPPPTPAGPQAVADHEDRLVAYLANWKACPSDAVMAPYTHVLVAFATTYTNPGANSASCTVGAPVLPCTTDSGHIARWRSFGKKVILSIGGWNMNGHWDHCFGKEESLATQLKGIVDSQGYDGVDIDFEQSNVGGNFISILTNKLKQKGVGEVTHAPMDSDLTAGHPYTEQLKLCASSLDFIMVQYYNGITRPNQAGVGFSGTGSCSGCVSARTHYEYLLNSVFGGDATKLVFGFCNGDCAGQASNIDGAQAVSVMQEIQALHPHNGGAMFWAVHFDTGANYISGPLDAYLGPLRGAPAPPTPTPPPTAAVTPPPTAAVTPPPTAAVTPPPTAAVTPPPTAAVTPPPTAAVTPPPTVNQINCVADWGQCGGGTYSGPTCCSGMNSECSGTVHWKSCTPANNAATKEEEKEEGSLNVVVGVALALVAGVGVGFFLGLRRGRAKPSGEQQGIDAAERSPMGGSVGRSGAPYTHAQTTASKGKVSDI